MRRAIQLLLVLLILSGCAGGKDRVVGKWTGELKASTNSKGLDGLAAGMASAFMGDLTYEFNKEGRFKISMNLGTADEGAYTVNGNEVAMTSDKGKKYTMTLDGDTLRLKKDFESDPDLVLKRQPSSQP